MKRAADNKRRYAPDKGYSVCLLWGYPKGAAPHLAHDFAKQSVVCFIRSVGVAVKMPLPPEWARAFEAAGKQCFAWGWEAGNKGLVSEADRAYMKAPSLVPAPPGKWTEHPIPQSA